MAAASTATAGADYGRARRAREEPGSRRAVRLRFLDFAALSPHCTALEIPGPSPGMFRFRGSHVGRSAHGEHRFAARSFRPSDGRLQPRARWPSSEAEGVRLTVDGRRREYLDCLAGIAVNALGHAHPKLVKAVTGSGGAAVARLQHLHASRSRPGAGGASSARFPSPTWCFMTNSGAQKPSSAAHQDGAQASTWHERPA